LIQAARVAGLDELGISDHFVLTPGFPCEWSMELDLLGDYVLELRQAARETRDVTLRIGLEADYFPDTASELRERLAPYPFDYVIGAVHYVDGFPLDSRIEDWQPLSDAEVVEVWRRYWELIGEMAATGLYDFAAHLDLPKKFGFRPTCSLMKEQGKALDAIAAAGMAIEINTAGWSVPAAEAYPSRSILEAARRRGIPLLINSDAHFPEFLTRNFDRAYGLAREVGYSELVRFAGRGRHPIPIPDSPSK
jgi:histidinol-phosphatase (PHP family)